MDLKQFDILLHDTEIKLKRLKALYEQWFQGIERLEPTVPRKEIDRTFVILNKEKPRNTAARFKLNTLQARYNTYATYWQRIARQIEEGTYERDVRRARRRRPGRQAEEKAEVKTYELDESQSFDPDSLFADDEISSVLTALDKGTERPPSTTPRRGLSSFSGLSGGKAADSLPPLDGEDTAPNAINPFTKPPTTATFGRPKSQPPAKPSFRPPTPESGSRRIPPAPPSGQRPAVPPPPRPAAPPPPPPKADPMKRLYDDFVAARRKNNVGGSLSYDKLASRVETMKSKLREKHGNRNIDFEVVVKDGKVGLKPKIR